MDSTNKLPNVNVTDFKRTKIIATVGPATNTFEHILDLVKAGANGIRLNFSHGTYEEREEQIKWVRKASKQLGKPVAVIQDLQGPKIRVGDFDDIINITTGKELIFEYKANYEQTGHIPTQYDLSKIVKKGEALYLYDGRIKTEITKVTEKLVHVVAKNNGVLIKRKSINLPDTDFAGDIITKKDKEDLAFGSTHDVDYVALSFVQTAGDIDQLRRMIKNLSSNAKIIAKIETQAAIKNIEDIVKSSDVVMIARGDLAVETIPESVPMVERTIIGLGLKYSKPTIVATQMLASMVESPEATRAEISDVATAVVIGADCVMLSDETANGQYPIQAVELMKRIILYTERNNPVKATFPRIEKLFKTQDAICNAAILLADNVDAVAIVAETKSGATALQIAAERPKRPIVTVTPDSRVAQQLAIVYGTKNYVRPDDLLAAVKLTNWLRENNILKKGDTIVTASGQYPGVIGTTDTIKVRVLK